MYTKNIHVTVNPAFDLTRVDAIIASIESAIDRVDTIVQDAWWFDNETVPYPKWALSWEKKLSQLEALRASVVAADRELEYLENTL